MTEAPIQGGHYQWKPGLDQGPKEVIAIQAHPAGGWWFDIGSTFELERVERIPLDQITEPGDTP